MSLVALLRSACDKDIGVGLTKACLEAALMRSQEGWFGGCLRMLICCCSCRTKWRRIYISDFYSGGGFCFVLLWDLGIFKYLLNINRHQFFLDPGGLSEIWSHTITCYWEHRSQRKKVNREPGIRQWLSWVAQSLFLLLPYNCRSLKDLDPVTVSSS